MNRYQRFQDEIDLTNTNSAAILPEIEIEEPLRVEFNPQHHTYSSNINKLKLFFLRRTHLERYLFILIILLLFILFIIIIISLSYYKKYSVNSLCLTSACIE